MWATNLYGDIWNSEKKDSQTVENIQADATEDKKNEINLEMKDGQAIILSHIKNRKTTVQNAVSFRLPASDSWIPNK